MDIKWRTNVILSQSSICQYLFALSGWLKMRPQVIFYHRYQMTYLPRHSMSERRFLIKEILDDLYVSAEQRFTWATGADVSTYCFSSPDTKFTSTRGSRWTSFRLFWPSAQPTLIIGVSVINPAPRVRSIMFAPQRSKSRMRIFGSLMSTNQS